MELRVEGFSKRFADVAGAPAFSLNLPPLSFAMGGVTFVMGHNGSGKSVLIKLLCGQLTPEGKDVTLRYGDEVLRAREYHAPFVRQRAEESLSGDLTVRENLLLRLEPGDFLDRLLPERRLSSTVREVVKQHPLLASKLDQPVNELSSGQRQALAFLAVTARRSVLLCLDEFLAATDHSTTLLLRDLARRYATETPACVLIASHDVELALEDAARILILKDGELVRDLIPGDSGWNRGSIIDLLV